MDNRKIYSLNKLAFIISAGVDVELALDNNNKCYGIVKDEVSGLLKDYNNDVELQKFLHSYQQIRKYIKDNKNKNIE